MNPQRYSLAGIESWGLEKEGGAPNRMTMDSNITRVIEDDDEESMMFD
jgi:hypothetical protein